MNGETRPAKVQATHSMTVVSLKHGVTVKVKSGEKYDGYLNQYGNFYNSDEVYLGTVPQSFEEVTS